MRLLSTAIGSALLAAALLLTPAAYGHIVPIPPAVCRFDPIALSVPSTATAGAAALGTTTDDLRVVFDTGANQAVFCPTGSTMDSPCGPAVDRAFQLGDRIGVLQLPIAFTARMWSSGDLTATGVPLALAVDGVGTSTAVTLTTGLVTVAGAVVAGAPIGGLGTFTLAGTLPRTALPGPIAAGDLLVRLTCQLTPNPDKDQFSPPARVTALRGKVAANVARVRASIAVSLFDPAQLTGRPLRLLVRAADAPIATATFSNGLTGAHRRLTGTSDDWMTTVTAQTHTDGTLVLTTVLHQVSLPPQTPGAPVIVGLIVDGGNLLTRGERLFAVTRDGRHLRPR